MDDIIYQDEFIVIKREQSEIPWLKIFTAHAYKELTDCPTDLRARLYRCTELIEGAMREYYKPEKINIAMFGNYLPHLHIHVMARFREDSFFPEPMWGKKQRESRLQLGDEKPFLDMVKERLKKGF